MFASSGIVGAGKVRTVSCPEFRHGWCSRGLRGWLSRSDNIHFCSTPRKKLWSPFSIPTSTHNGFVVPPQCVCNTALDPHVTSDNDNCGTPEHRQPVVHALAYIKGYRLYTEFGLGSRKFVCIPDLAWHDTDLENRRVCCTHSYLTAYFSNSFTL